MHQPRHFLLAERGALAHRFHRLRELSLRTGELPGARPEELERKEKVIDTRRVELGNARRNQEQQNQLAQTLELQFVLTTVQRALGQAVPLICNSDQGSHFSSPQYLALLQAANVQISMDGKGRALDNIFTERLWRTVKYEEVYIHEYTSPREARQALSRYFAFYNQERLHQALDYQTPAEVYFHEVSAGQRQNE